MVFDERVDQDQLREDFSGLVERHGEVLTPRFLFTPDTPYYEKKGVAAKNTDADVILFADSDCSYSETWLDELLAPILEGRADLASGFTQAQPGNNYVEKVCEVAWFFPTVNARDPLRAKASNRFFANNFAVTRAAIDAVPLPRIKASRSHGGYWVSKLREHSYRVEHVPGAIATHKQYDTWGDYFARAWLLGKDKDAAASMKRSGRAYRIKRAFGAYFELTVKYLRRFFVVAGSIHSVPGLLPALLLGLAFQWFAATSQMLSALFTPAVTSDFDYAAVTARARFV